MFVRDFKISGNTKINEIYIFFLNEKKYLTRSNWLPECFKISLGETKSLARYRLLRLAHSN